MDLIQWKMYADTAFYNADKSITQKQMEVICENEWCYTYGWMYCGADRACYTDGIYEINNTLYILINMESWQLRSIYADGENYLAQEGWKSYKNAGKWLVSKAKEKYYYIENGEVIKKKTLEN